MKKLIEKTGTSALRDPYLFKYQNRYYRCYTPDCRTVEIAVADTLDAIGTAEGVCVYAPTEDWAYPNELWAPELYVFDGKCYLYLTCTDGEGRNHRMFVLENDSDDPMARYRVHGKITDPTDKWAIDGTMMDYRGVRYYIWSGWEGDENISQNLYITKLKNPYELEGERVLISKPEYDWEKLGSEDGLPMINEGAFAFSIGGVQYLAYSAAGSWSKHYCIAVLKLVGEDPLDPTAWEKLPQPLLSCNERVQGAGHCSMIFEDGRYRVFFHAWDKDETNITWNTVSLWQAELSETEDGLKLQ